MNVNYSYNGYMPLSKEIIDKKNELKNKLLTKEITYKEYSKACTDMKRGWKRKSLLDVPVKELNNSEIVGSSFAQEKSFTDVFPSDMTGVTFRNCNLGNCNIPAGNTTVECFNKHYETQNDGEEWIVDETKKPIEPLNPKRYDKFNLSKDPKDLPPLPLVESIIVSAQNEKIKQDRKDKILSIANDPEKLQELIDSGKEL